MWVLIGLCLIILFISLINNLTKNHGFDNLEVNRYFTERRISEGDTAELNYVITNDKLYPVWFIDVSEDMSAGAVLMEGQAENGGAQFCMSLSLMPFQRASETVRLLFEKRGRYILRTLSVTIGDPFAINTYSKHYDDMTEILVYPRIYRLSDLIVDSSDPQGDVSVTRWIIDDPILTMGIREYVPGDSLRNVSWKATARNNKIMVRLFDHTSTEKVLIMLNIETSIPFWADIDEEKIEDAIHIAASLCSELLRSGVPTGLICNGSVSKSGGYRVDIPPSASPRQFAEIMDALAGINYLCSMPFHDMVFQKAYIPDRDTSYIIITAIVSEQLARCMERFISMGAGISVILLNGSEVYRIPKGVKIHVSKQGEGADHENTL